MHWKFCPLCGAPWRSFWTSGSLRPLLGGPAFYRSQSVGCQSCWKTVLKREWKAP